MLHLRMPPSVSISGQPTTLTSSGIVLAICDVNGHCDDKVDALCDDDNVDGHLWDKVYPIQVKVPPMGGNGRLLR